MAFAYYPLGEIPVYYFYETNLQGDIINIYDENGAKVVGFRYDAWGSFNTDKTNTTVCTDTFLRASLFRYRSYIYDYESNLYYLQSRYYDPETGRFINADNIGYLGTNGDLLGYNLYAYCSNNPVMLADASGFAWETIFDILSLGASIMEVAFNPLDPFAWLGLAGDTADLIPIVNGIGETIRTLKSGKKIAEGTDDAIDTYRALRKINKGTDLEVHHIVEKRFKIRSNIKIDNTNNMLSTALTSSKHQAFTSKWRELAPYGGNYDKKKVLSAAIGVYRNDPQLLGVAIFTIVNG